MKTLAALDLHYLVEELKAIEGAKVEKFYHPKKKELVIHFYVRGMGKKILRIVVPGFVYLTDFRQKQPEKPSGFCVMLRKYLDNAKLVSIKQYEFERVIELEFEKKERFRLICELFSKGNIVFCREDYAIIRPLEVQIWSARSVKPRVKYVFPEKGINFITLTKEELGSVFEKSKKDVVRTLAIDLGLGGVYAEELCLIAKIEKNTKGLDEKTIGRLFKAIEKLRTKEIAAQHILDKDRIADIVPFKLNYYKDHAQKGFKSFNLALDAVLSNELEKQEEQQVVSKQQKKIEKMQYIINEQIARVKGLEKSIVDNSRKGDLIFENYKLVEEVLIELNKAAKTHSWKDIKTKLKCHKLIKSIDEKKKEVVLDLN